MATTQTLYYMSQQLNIYWGLFMFIIGIIGDLWNILVFRHYSLRLSSCCTYMLIGSIASLIQTIFSLSDRIIDEGFQIHWTTNSTGWCKIRYYIAQCASLIALSCHVWSVIDRFFSTCRQIKWRHLNSVYIAKRICSFIILFWIFLCMPTFIFARPIQITLDKRLCISSSIIWSKIIIYFINLCCYGIFPWFFMSLFGCLTLRNIRRTQHCRIGTLRTHTVSRMVHIDHQLYSMLFLQIIICIISSIPFCIQVLYNHLTQTIVKNEYRQAQEYLFLQITLLIFYFNYVSTFYVNYLSSAIFRQVSKQVLVNLFKKQEDRSTQITIVNHQENNNQVEKQKRCEIFIIQPNSFICRV